MCILLVSTIHPKYPFILLDNRDARPIAPQLGAQSANKPQEYRNRPTARAHWWDAPNNHVLGGRDLQRSVHGTWLGITRRGRLAVLTNFREPGAEALEGARSRGEMPIAFLTVDPNSGEGEEGFAARFIQEEGIHGVGGFSLAFGILRKKANMEDFGRLALISNRTGDVKSLKYSTPGTWGLSNSHFGDRGWPKVVNGEQLLEEVSQENIRDKGSADDLIERCFVLLSTDTLPKRQAGQDMQTYTYHMRKSIFIPAVGDADTATKVPADEVAAAQKMEPVKVGGGLYGTQKQTVVLVDQQGRVTFVERTLYDHDGKPVTGEERDVVFEFNIEGWDD